MSTPPLTLTVEAGTGVAHLRLAGDLDYDTSDELTRRGDACLADHPQLRELHLDCAELRLCDSMGLSVMLMLYRRTSARDIALHLDNVPPFLERMLHLTGIRHLFAPSRQEPQQVQQAHAEETPERTRTPQHPAQRQTPLA